MVPSGPIVGLFWTWPCPRLACQTICASWPLAGARTAYRLAWAAGPAPTVKPVYTVLPDTAAVPWKGELLAGWKRQAGRRRRDGAGRRRAGHRRRHRCSRSYGGLGRRRLGGRRRAGGRLLLRSALTGDQHARPAQGRPLPHSFEKAPSAEVHEAREY